MRVEHFKGAAQPRPGQGAPAPPQGFEEEARVRRGRQVRLPPVRGRHTPT